MDIKNLTIKEAHDLLINKKMSVLELLEAVLEKAEETKDINGYLEIFDDVRIQAQIAQNMIDEGQHTLLTGIPLGMKDNILIKGKIASASSKMLEHSRQHTILMLQKSFVMRVRFLLGVPIWMNLRWEDQQKIPLLV